MRDQTFAEEALLSRKGAIDELVDDDKIAGSQVLAEAADRRKRDDVSDAAAFQRVDIGAEVDFRRRQYMAAAVARNKHDRIAVQRPEAELVRSGAERALDAPPFDIGEAVDIVEAAAADNADDGLAHPQRLMRGGPDLSLGGVEDAGRHEQEQH